LLFDHQYGTRPSNDPSFKRLRVDLANRVSTRKVFGRSGSCSVSHRACGGFKEAGGWLINIHYCCDVICVIGFIFFWGFGSSGTDHTICTDVSPSPSAPSSTIPPLHLVKVEPTITPTYLNPHLTSIVLLSRSPYLARLMDHTPPHEPMRIELDDEDISDEVSSCQDRTGWSIEGIGKLGWLIIAGYAIGCGDLSGTSLW
jgi:hypothetical protein